MELTHSFTVPTAVDDAWDLFMDLERVGSCFPGATVTEVTDKGFSGTVKVKLGPIALLYTGTGSFVERDDASHRATLEAKGKDKRGNGTAGATVTIALSPDGTGTRADVVTDLAVTGKPAQFGRGVMQDVSDKLLLAFVDCIEKRLTAGPEEPVPAEAAVPAPVPAAETAVPAVVAPAAAAPVPVPAAAAPSAAPRTQPPFGDSSETHTAGMSARPSAAYARPPRTVTSEIEEDNALDLGSAVMPVLMQRYAGYAAAAVIGIVIGWLFGRSRSR
ncbi:carbon monoxide dehydrogenase [Intrasporangium oryzae NRRL B-24470]|uniref:Carbon monoxide dehydrogenase n=1 Tax=Intrasporangium oryzae NRRL B-24470 TaxID=1386089 RepID=W9G102_9MICO|nr:SRPBCC family protein [Intrasporangium oryzae]EWS99775.1 carbon monoxide dehydrogenase [Intrasporangium oryzae NRRL B-24470]